MNKTVKYVLVFTAVTALVSGCASLAGGFIKGFKKGHSGAGGWPSRGNWNLIKTGGSTGWPPREKANKAESGGRANGSLQDCEIMTSPDYTKDILQQGNWKTAAPDDAGYKPPQKKTNIIKTGDSAENLLYEKGILSERSFESRYLDLRFTLPEGFHMATRQSIECMLKMSDGLLGLEGEAVDYTNLTTVYEMMAFAPSGCANVIVMAEETALENITVEQYVDPLIGQLAYLTEKDYSLSDVTLTEIAGQEYKQFTFTSSSVRGQNMTQNYMLRKNGDRIVGFIATSAAGDEEAIAAMMKGFAEH